MKLLNVLTVVTLLAVVGLAYAATPARAEEAPAATVQNFASLLPDIASDDPAKRTAAMKAIETLANNAARPGAETERVAVATALAGKLDAATPSAARVWLLRQIQWIGKAEVVPALVQALDDKDAVVRDSARRALQWNTAPEATPALVVAMQKAATPDWQVAMINAVAVRKDATTVPVILKYLADKDASVVEAAVGALGKIGGADAAKALDGLRVTASPKLRPYVIDAYLQCADKMLKEDKNDEAAAIYKAVYVPAEPKPTRIAGLRGLVLALGVKAMPMVAEVLAGNDAQMQAIALSFAGEIPGPEATKALADLLPKLPAPGQALLLAQLGRRGDMAAKPAVLGSLKSADDAVRTAAFGALATIGDASDVPALAQAAAGGGAEADAARNSLATMKAQNANAAMLAAMTGDAKVRAELLRALTARKSAEAAPAMLKAADDADAAVRAEAFKGLEAVADEKCLAPMIALLIKTKDTDAAEKALLATCGRATNKDVALQVILTPLASAQMPAKGSLLKALGRLGGPKAILPVRAALKDADMGVREAAVRALADWSDMTAAPDLIAVGKSEGKLTLKVLALRGYLRLAALPEVPAAQKLQMSQEALTVITRPDEKKLVLGVLADVNQPAALLIVVPMLDDNALKNEACTAAVKIAKSLGNNLPPETRAAMEKCLTITKDKKLITDANDVMKRIKPAKK